MTLIDRHIARHYLANIATLFLFLFAVVVVVDFSLNFDEYAESAAKLAGAEASWARQAWLSVWLVADLWWPRLFQLYNYLLGIVLVGAMGFTCAQMVKGREFVALLAGGQSLHRIARPIVLVALALTTLQALNRELLIPRLAPLLTREKNEAGSRSLGVTRQPLCADSMGRLFYARSVDLDAGTIDGLWVWERDADGLMERRITAPKARWDGKAWVLERGQAEVRQPGDSGRTATRAEPVLTLETDLDPTALRLRRFEGYSNNLSTAQIGELIGRVSNAATPPRARIDRLERIRFGRVAGLLGTMLTLLLCLPFFMRREPANMLRQSLAAAPVTLLAFVATLLGTTAAVPGLPPQLSVFIPVMILIPLAIAAVTSVKT